ncbi:MAG: radical SAM protein [Theionarchaea archaeon]|nr:radical SAM protein [Theionarchaea archaeon]
MNKEGLHFLETELTSLCNFECSHCYAVTDHSADMPFPLVETILQQAHEMGVEVIIFTGGEPLLYPNIAKALQRAKDMKFEVRLQTNGSLINEENYKMFDGLTIVQIGYDLPPEKGGIRGNISEDLIKEKVDIVKHADVRSVTLFITLHRNNVHAVDYFASLASSWNVTVAFNTFSPAGRGKTHQDLQLSSEELKEIYEILWDYYKNGKISRPTDPLIFLFREDLKEKALETPHRIVGGCMAGITSLSITPSGDALPCPLLRIPVGNLYHDSLKDIWRHSHTLRQLRGRVFEGHCRTCKFVNACGGCRTRAYSIRSSIVDEDPYCFLHSSSPG